MDEVMSPALPSLDAGGDRALAAETVAVEAFKKVTLLGIGAAMQRFGAKLQDEQEVLLWLADLIIDTFAAESAVLRARSVQLQPDAAASKAALHEDAARVFVSDAALRVEAAAKQVLAAIAEGDVLRTNLAALRRLLKVTPADTVAARRRLADDAVARGAYGFA
jgi:alkylation response protein AidB-like acyl-CoA dehydrogenase